MTGPDVLHRLVDDLDRLREAWERRPLVSTGLGDFSDVFSVELVERLLFGGLPVQTVRLFSRGEVLPRRLLAGARGADRHRDHLLDGHKAVRAVAAGATLVVDDLQSFSPPVAAFATAVSRASGYQTDCTAFLTPGRARGVAPHHDPASGFLRQVSGSKRWQVWAPAGPGSGPAPGAAGGPEPVLEATLLAGDCLYIPRGFVHAGQTTDEPSAHMSISVRSVTWAAVFGDLLDRIAAGSPQLRECLPPAFAGADLPGLFAERADLVGKHLAGYRWSDVDPGSLLAAPVGPPPEPGLLGAALRDGSAPGRGPARPGAGR
jgi:bifunctional lysine-specific demethylase and histidyl-hydroxylase NO66